MAFLTFTMTKRFHLSNWIPALIMMGAIFFVSSQPSVKLPDFNWADRLVKKTGHMVGYALLAISYKHGLGNGKYRTGLAWLFALLYATSDEYHQSFVPGRNPSIWDVFIFDNIGAVAGLWVFSRFRKKTDQALLPDR
jgi:VanZ family protein